MIPPEFVPLINHLWQSTLFALAVGSIALVLVRNSPEVRYRLWLAASLKFVFPFSLLVSFGALAGDVMPLRSISSITTQPHSFLVESIVPFSALPIARGALDRAEVASSAQWVPAVILLIWLSGFIAVLWVWFRRWRHSAMLAAGARRLHAEPETETIQRLRHAFKLRQQLRVAVTEETVEPGLFGIVHPTLLLPEGIQSRLTMPQLESILAHELFHLQRCDNLFAFFHTLVEAVFWFHPLVWWIGSRLVVERELACDQSVVRFGGDRQVYAEAILNVCEFYVASAPCVSGITPANLKKRIHGIMNRDFGLRLSFTARTFLTAATLTLVGIPILFGLAQGGEAAEMPNGTPSLKFARASIKWNLATSGALLSNCHAIDSGLPADSPLAPGHCVMTRLTLQQLIAESYGPLAISIEGGADWTAKETFDIEAEAADPSSVTRSAFRQMFRSLLAERFKLSLHRTTSEAPGFAIRISDSGLKLVESAHEEPHRGFAHTGPGALNGRHMLVTDLARNLSAKLGRPVIDRTGLSANYDFTLNWTPGLDEAGYIPGASGLSIFTAIQQQMGLRLEPRKVTIDVLVIDHAERPADNER